MKNIFSPSELKELKLLQVLLQTDFKSIDELQSTIQTSSGNVWRIINKLENEFSKYLLLIKDGRHRVKFISTDAKIDAYLLIKKNYLERNINFKFLDALFYEKYNSVQDFCDANYISLGLFYRKKKDIEILVTNNKLEINTRKFRISSDNDIYIREFYYYFYWESYKSQHWPFETVNRYFLEQSLFKFLKSKSINLSKIETEQVLFRLAIMMVRIMKKHYFDPSILDKLIPSELIDYISDLNIFNNISILETNVLAEQMYIAFCIVSNYSSAYIKTPIPNSYFLTYYEQTDSKQWELTEQFFYIIKNNFKNKFDLQNMNFDQEYLHMMNIHIYSTFFNDSCVPSTIASSINELSPLNKKIAEYIYYNNQIDGCSQNYYYSLYYYSLFVESFFIFPKVNVALDLSYDRVTLNKLKRLLNSTFKDIINIIDSRTNKDQIDLVISDVFIGDSDNWFVLSPTFSDYDFELLKEVIYDLYLKKNQYHPN